MRQRAFTIIELLVVVSIIALLVGILLPAIGKAREQAKLTQSQANLRNLVVAMQTYASEWNDRQLSLTADNYTSYGATAEAANIGYAAANGPHPPLIAGWGYLGGDPNNYALLAWGWAGQQPVQHQLLMPIGMTPGLEFERFGWFRMSNVAQFNRYLSGKLYDPVFYAPKDKPVMATVEPLWDTPDETGPGAACWPSYCLSASALYSPDVFSSDGYTDPFDLPGACRTPGMSQALYSDLKTQFMEHNWLQGNKRSECNPDLLDSIYDGCEPWYYNVSRDSSPVASFFDGHIEAIGVTEAQQADTRSVNSGGGPLWSRDTPFGQDGYFSEYRLPFEPITSFHVFTADGIRGRDKDGR